MAAKDVAQWLVIATMLLGGGMWLGRLQQKVDDQGRVEQYLHGRVSVPEGAQ